VFKKIIMVMLVLLVGAVSVGQQPPEKEELRPGIWRNSDEQRCITIAISRAHSVARQFHNRWVAEKAQGFKESLEPLICGEFAAWMVKAVWGKDAPPDVTGLAGWLDENSARASDLAGSQLYIENLFPLADPTRGQEMDSVDHYVIAGDVVIAFKSVGTRGEEDPIEEFFIAYGVAAGTGEMQWAHCALPDYQLRWEEAGHEPDSCEPVLVEHSELVEEGYRLLGGYRFGFFPDYCSSIAELEDVTPPWVNRVAEPVGHEPVPPVVIPQDVEQTSVARRSDRRRPGRGNDVIPPPGIGLAEAAEPVADPPPDDDSANAMKVEIAGAGGRPGDRAGAGATWLSARSVHTSSVCPRCKVDGIYPTDCVGELVSDNRLETAWCEGVRGWGEGEWIEVDLGRTAPIVGVEVRIGYQKSDWTFEENGVPTEIQVIVADQPFLMKLDATRHAYRGVLARPIEAATLHLRITQVRPGAGADQDTCITSIGIGVAGDSQTTAGLQR